MEILKFNDFISEGEKAATRRMAVGVAVVYDNKILLIHPTNASWRKPTCGIPKGGIEPGEEPIDGALRELMEETGIALSPDQLESETYRTYFYNSHNEVTGQLVYFVCKVSDLSEIGLSSEKVPKSQLQLEEVDWAKFISAKEAYPLISREQLIILDRHLSFS